MCGFSVVVHATKEAVYRVKSNAATPINTRMDMRTFWYDVMAVSFVEVHRV